MLVYWLEQKVCTNFQKHQFTSTTTAPSLTQEKN